MAYLKKHKFIILILVTAFIIRLGAVDYGLPHLLAFGDEIVHIAAGFNLLAQKTLRANFNFYYVPPLFSYLLAPIFSLIGLFGILLGKFQGIADYQNFVLLKKEYFLAVSRIISAILGTGAVYLIYLLAKKIFSSQKISLIAALFLTFDFFSVHESQLGRFWMPLTFFFLAAAYFIYRLYKEGDLKWYLLAGLMIGFGFGAGYAAIMMSLWFLISHLSRKKEGFWSKKLFAGAGLILGLTFLFSYLNPTAFIRQFGHMIFTIGSFFGQNISFTEIDAPSQVQSAAYYFKLMIGFLWHNSPLFFIFGLLGFLIIGFSKKERLLKFLLIGVPVVYLFIITFLFSGIEGRYVLPAVPFFILAASYFIVEVSGRFKTSKLQKGLLAILVLTIGSYSFYISSAYALKLRRPDTRIQALNWIYKNFEPSSSIIMGEEYLELNETKESILFLKENNPSRVDTKRNHLLTLDEKEYPQPYYLVYHLGRLDSTKLDFQEIKPNYLIFSFWTKEIQKTINDYPYQKELIKKFYPKKEVSDLGNLLNEPASRPFWTLNNIDYFGPYVEIYKLQ